MAEQSQPSDVVLSIDQFEPFVKVHGPSYKPLKTCLFYNLVGHTIRFRSILIGDMVRTDPRTPMGIALPPGRGKSAFIRAVRTVVSELPSRNENLDAQHEIVEEPNSFHPEALLGRAFYSRRKDGVYYEQVPGAFAADYIILDDCLPLLQSDDPANRDSRQKFQKALDRIGENEVSKSQSGIPHSEQLRFIPNFTVLLCFQPEEVSGDLLKTGFTRRFLLPLVSIPDDEWYEGLSKRRIADPGHTQTIIDAFLALARPERRWKFDADITDAAMAFAKRLVAMGKEKSLIHPQVANGFTVSARDTLIRWSCCQAALRQRSEVHVHDCVQAYHDLQPVWVAHMNFLAHCLAGSRSYSRLDKDVLRSLALIEDGINVADWRELVRDFVGQHIEPHDHLRKLETYDYVKRVNGHIRLKRPCPIQV